jgi:hypothetical protein
MLSVHADIKLLPLATNRFTYVENSKRQTVAKLRYLTGSVIQCLMVRSIVCYLRLQKKRGII